MKTNNYTFQNVKEIPLVREDGIVYVCDEDKVAWLKCPCGCKDDVVVNLLHDAKPCWKIDGNTLHPSVVKRYGCQSHFTITNGVVKMY